MDDPFGIKPVAAPSKDTSVVSDAKDMSAANTHDPFGIKPVQAESPAVKAEITRDIPLNPQEKSFFKDLPAGASDIANVAAGAELPLEMKLLPGILKVFPLAARAIAAGTNTKIEDVNAGIGDVIKGAAYNMFNPKYSLTNLAAHAGGYKVPDTSSAKDIAEQVAGVVLGSGITSPGALITKAPGLAASVGLGMAGGELLPKLAKYIPDSNPQTKAAAEGLLNLAGGVIGGVTGDKIAGGIGNKFSAFPDQIKTKLSNLPTTTDVANATQTKAVLDNPNAQALMQNGPEVQTPVAVAPSEQLASINNEAKPTPQTNFNDALGLNVEPLTPEQQATHMAKAYDLSQDMVGKAQDLNRNMFKEVGTRVGDNPIELDKDAISSNNKLSKLKDFSQALDKAQLPEFSLDIPTFKQSLNWIKDNFINDLFSAQTKGEPINLNYDTAQKSLNILNSLQNSLNLSNLPGPIQKQLLGYRAIIKKAINEHLAGGEQSGMYPEGTGALYKNADQLYGRIKGSQGREPFLDPGANFNDATSNAKSERGTFNSLLSGNPTANLEHITRTMQDVAPSLPGSEDFVNSNMNNLQKLHTSVQQVAAAQGKSSDFTQGFLNERALLNRDSSLNADTLINSHSPLSLGNIPELQEGNYVNKGNFDSSKLNDDIFSNKNTNAVNLLTSINKYPERREQFAPLLNASIKDHIANMFPQGLTQGSVSNTQLKGIIDKMSNGYDTFSNSKIAPLLDDDLKTTLINAKEAKRIMDLSEEDPTFTSRLNNLVDKFNEKSPNAATQATNIFQKMKDVAATITTQERDLKPEAPGTLSQLVNKGLSGKFLTVIKNALGSRDQINPQLDTLADIRSKMETPSGRQSLPKRLDKANDVLKRQKDYEDAGLVSSLYAGALSGAPRTTNYKSGITPSPYVESAEEKIKRIKAAARANQLSKLYP